MRRTYGLIALVLCLAVAGPRLITARADEPLDALFRAYWEAPTAADASVAANAIAATHPGFDRVWTRLSAGRPYTNQPTGLLPMPRAVDGHTLNNMIDVPASYDPSRRWPLRVQLHGGVNRPLPSGHAPTPLVNRIPGESQIYIHPRAWAGASWWHGNQVNNIAMLIDHVKRRYNVDESRVYVTGISDGGTGVYFLAMRYVTPWAACLPLNGHMRVLANPSAEVDGEMFFNNLANCPFYIVNGGRDRLYPSVSVAPQIEMMQRAGMPLVFRVHPEAGHDTSWWPIERPLYERFLSEHARVAHPARLTWETERVDRYNRVRWLRLDALGAQPSDVALDDPGAQEGMRGRSLFPHRVRSGRVDIARDGNTFEAKTRGVRQFSLLLSRDAVDFSKPVKVVVNGREVFADTVKEDVETLLRWAVRDNDRTMLYGAELPVKVP